MTKKVTYFVKVQKKNSKEKAYKKGNTYKWDQRDI